MTDEEMANKYAHDKMSFCEDYDFNYNVAKLYIKQGVLYGLAEGRKDNTENFSALEKENAELKERLKGFEDGEVAWQGDMDRTIEQNLQLKEEVEALESKMDRMKKFLPAYMFSKYFLEEDK